MRFVAEQSEGLKNEITLVFKHNISSTYLLSGEILTQRKFGTIGAKSIKRLKNLLCAKLNPR